MASSHWSIRLAERFNSKLNRFGYEHFTERVHELFIVMGHKTRVVLMSQLQPLCKRLHV
jgi:hypothetical protein